MTATLPQPLFIDDDGYYRITTPGLAHEALTHPDVTTADALVPTTPLLRGTADQPGPADIMERVTASPAGRQAQRSLLATTGRRHHYLASPVEVGVRTAASHPKFPAEVQAYAHDLADHLTPALAAGDTVDLAHHTHHVPAEVAVDLFGLPVTARELRPLARAQTGLIWDRAQTWDTQMRGLAAARRLQEICAETIREHAAALDAGHPLADVTTWLLGALDQGETRDVDALGLVYGVGIAAVEGTGWSILNTVVDVLADPRGLWAHLATAPSWRAAYTLVLPFFRANPGIHSILRTTTGPVRLGGGWVPTGATIAVDLRALAAPFGGDPLDNQHYCTGAPAGRVELGVVPWVLARRFPHLALLPGEPGGRMDSRFFNGYARARVHLEGM